MSDLETIYMKNGRFLLLNISPGFPTELVSVMFRIQISSDEDSTSRSAQDVLFLMPAMTYY